MIGLQRKRLTVALHGLGIPTAILLGIAEVVVAFRISWRAEYRLLKGANGVVETAYGIEQVALVVVGLPGFGIDLKRLVVAFERPVIAPEIP
jgi:hypothetical protein